MAKSEDTVGTFAIVGILGYIFWCIAVFKKSGTWSFTPWTAPAIERRKMLAARAQTEDEKRAEQEGVVTLIVP